MICMPDPPKPYKLAYKKKLVARTTPEMVHWANGLRNQLRLDGVEFCGQAMSLEGLLNGIYLFFRDRTAEEQLRILGEYIPHFEALLDGSPGAQGDGPGVVTDAGSELADEVAPRRSRKGAG